MNSSGAPGQRSDDAGPFDPLPKLHAYFDPSTSVTRAGYADAISRYGKDNPDVRFGMEIVDITNIVKDSGFKLFAEVALKRIATINIRPVTVFQVAQACDQAGFDFLFSHARRLLTIL